MLGSFSSVGSRTQEAFVLVFGYVNGQVIFVNMRNINMSQNLLLIFLK